MHVGSTGYKAYQKLQGEVNHDAACLALLTWAVMDCKSVRFLA